jgi:signal transduction histidine kinase
MPERSENSDVNALREKIIGLGEKSIRKSYYPELQQRVNELEIANTRLLREIAERKRSEEAIRDAGEKFRTLFNAMTEMVVLHELVYDDRDLPCDYRIIECNEVFTQITGIKADTAIGSLGSVVYGMKPPPYLEVFSSVAISGTPYFYSDYYAPMDKYFSISVVSPKKNQFATITTDVTPVTRIKDILAAKNRELENYLYIASHDLRSPLVNIQGFSARLKKQAESIHAELSSSCTDRAVVERLDPVLSEAIPRTLEFIFTNVAKMDKLINGLLQISRTGRIVMNVRMLDMNRLVRGVLDGFSFQIEQAHADVFVDSLPPCYGDETLVNQVFSNLVSNALKYRDTERPLEIRISGESRAHHSVYCLSDTGIGIAERHLLRIWDVFYRVDWSGPISGDGVGLSIVKRIIDKHRGKVRVESRERKGSSFYIELPSEPFSEDS